MNRERLNLGFWMELWDKSGALGDPMPLYWELNDTYIAKDRLYHGVKHINEGWHVLRMVEPKPRRLLQLGFAIAGHDVIQSRDDKGNDEPESANFIYQRLGEAKFPRYFRRDVSKLIIVTDHKTPPRNYDQMVMADIDLIRFGKSEDEFDLDCSEIRIEYTHVADEIYKPTRAKILQRFLERQKIYYTAYFEPLEAQARKNLNREIARLLS